MEFSRFGIIDVCFEVPYADRPAIAVTQQHPNDEVLELPIERLREIRSTDNCVIVSSCRCGFTAVCGDEGGNTLNQGGSIAPAPSRMAHFIADGPRWPTADGSDHPCMKLIGAGARRPAPALAPPPPPPPPHRGSRASRASPRSAGGRGLRGRGIRARRADGAEGEPARPVPLRQVREAC